MQSPEPGFQRHDATSRSASGSRRRRRPRDTARLLDEPAAGRLPRARAANGQEAQARPRPRARCRAARDQHARARRFRPRGGLQADERTRGTADLLTTEVGPLVKAKAFETGAHGVIRKPFDPGAVTSFIERVVAQVVPRRLSVGIDPY